MPRFVFDTTLIVKGLVEPRRKKQDEELEKALTLHKKAREYLEQGERGEIQMIIPSAALIETASVVSRLTNDHRTAMEAVNFLWENAEILFDYETLRQAIETGIRTKASGFDNLFLAACQLADAVLLTDDSRLHILATENGLESRLLREMK